MPAVEPKGTGTIKIAGGPKPTLPPTLISIPEAAALAQVHPRTLQRWIQSGHLTRYRRGGPLGSSRRAGAVGVFVDRAQLEELLRQQGEVSPA